MSHPDPAAAPDTRPIEPGEVWENPVTLERAVIVEVPWLNEAGRVAADLTALPGARVVGEHLHPRAARALLRPGGRAHDAAGRAAVGAASR
jgi:hypothetical protein